MTGENSFTGDRVIPSRGTGRFARSNAHSEHLVQDTPDAAKRNLFSTLEGTGRGYGHPAHAQVAQGPFLIAD